MDDSERKRSASLENDRTKTGADDDLVEAASSWRERHRSGGETISDLDRDINKIWRELKELDKHK